MPFEKFTGFTFSHAAQDDTPDLTPEQVKTAFDSRGEELKTFLDSLIDILNSAADGGSGADNVAATAIEGLTGNTVQALLESLKTALDEAILGAIPDGSLATAKYADKSVTAAKVADDVATATALSGLAGTGRTAETVKGNADNLATHLAEEVNWLFMNVRGVRYNG